MVVNIIMGMEGGRWNEGELESQVVGARLALFAGAIRGDYDPSPRRKREQGKEGRRREIRVVVALQGICVGTVRVETVRIGENCSSKSSDERTEINKKGPTRAGDEEADELSGDAGAIILD